MANIYGRSVIDIMTNKSGVPVVAGDIVVPDGSNDSAFTTTTSASVTTPVWVVQESIANNGTGRVLVAGEAALVNVNASVTRGHYGATYTVAKQATDGGASRTAGTFCYFRTGGTTPKAYIYPTDLLGTSLTNPMTTAEDIIKGGAAGAPARLAVGAAGGALSVINSAVAWNSGTSMPGSKATGDRYWRTDLGLEAFWDGTRWLTTQLFEFAYSLTALAAGNAQYAPVNRDIYVVDLISSLFVLTTNDGTHYWNVNLNTVTSGNVEASLGSHNTSADTHDTFTLHTTAINTAVATASFKALDLACSKTSTPGNLYGGLKFTYRLVLT